MNRRSFLSAFLSSAAAAIVTPQIVTHGLGLKYRKTFPGIYVLIGIETFRIVGGQNIQQLPKGESILDPRVKEYLRTFRRSHLDMEVLPGELVYAVHYTEQRSLL